MSVTRRHGSSGSFERVGALGNEAAGGVALSAEARSGRENNKVFGRAQSLVAGPPKNGVQFYGQGLEKIRFDRRLERRSIQRRQTRR